MGGFAVWLERVPVCLPKCIRCEKLVLTVTRSSSLYVFRRLVVVLPGCSSLVGIQRVMAGRGRWPAVDSRPILMRRFLLEYL